MVEEHEIMKLPITNIHMIKLPFTSFLRKWEQKNFLERLYLHGFMFLFSLKSEWNMNASETVTSPCEFRIFIIPIKFWIYRRIKRPYQK